MTEEPSPRFVARTARVVLDKAPRLAGLRVIRLWAGGWSGRGMLLAPYAAELLAREIAGHGDAHLAPFAPDRFAGRSAVVAAPGDYYSGYLR